jgi:hypothetical protein
MTLLILASAAVAIFAVTSVLAIRSRDRRRGTDAFTSDLTRSYEFSADAFRTSGLVSVGGVLINHPLPEVVVDRSVLRIRLTSAGFPETLGIRRCDVSHVYTHRGVNGVGFGFKDRTHRADGVTIWCGSREPLWTALADLGWLTPTSMANS